MRRPGDHLMVAEKIGFLVWILGVGLLSVLFPSRPSTVSTSFPPTRRTGLSASFSSLGAKTALKMPLMASIT